MKKLSVRMLCLVLVLMFAALSTASAATTNVREYKYIKTNSGIALNVRSDPWKAENNIVTSLPYGSLVLVYQYSDNGTWAYIEGQRPGHTGTVKGWVSSTYLVKNDPGKYVPPVDPTPTPAPSSNKTFDAVNNAAKALKVLSVPYTTVIQTKNATNYVHLRWFPNTNAVYSGAYLRNTPIIVLAESNDWAQVQIVSDGKIGFIIKSCVAPVWN